MAKTFQPGKRYLFRKPRRKRRYRKSSQRGQDKRLDAFAELGAQRAQYNPKAFGVE